MARPPAPPQGGRRTRRGAVRPPGRAHPPSCRKHCGSPLCAGAGRHRTATHSPVLTVDSCSAHLYFGSDTCPGSLSTRQRGGSGDNHLEFEPKSGPPFTPLTQECACIPVVSHVIILIIIHKGRFFGKAPGEVFPLFIIPSHFPQHRHIHDTLSSKGRHYASWTGIGGASLLLFANPSIFFHEFDPSPLQASPRRGIISVFSRWKYKRVGLAPLFLYGGFSCLRSLNW